MILRRLQTRNLIPLLFPNTLAKNSLPPKQALKGSTYFPSKMTFIQTYNFSAEKAKSQFDIEDILNELGKKSDQQYEEPYVISLFFLIQRFRNKIWIKLKPFANQSAKTSLSATWNKYIPPLLPEIRPITKPTRMWSWSSNIMASTIRLFTQLWIT